MAANDINNKGDKPLDDEKEIDEIFSDSGSGVLKEICIKYKKYIATGVMVILLAVLIFSSQAASQGNDHTQDGQISETEKEGNNTKTFAVDADAQINELIGTYYEYYAKGDVDAIEKIAYPITETEKNYIKMFSGYLDRYENIKCYTQKGEGEGEYIVFVSHNMRFKGIDTGAPGLACFYVRKDKDGTDYIDNAYSQFNQSKKENETDDKINALLTASGQSADIANVQEDIQREYDSALEADKDLHAMVTGTIRELVTSFESEVSADGVQTDNQKNMRRTAYAKTSVNLRKKRSTDSEVVKTLQAGSKVTIYGVSKNGWFKVKSGDDAGYVKKEYIVSDPSKAEGADNQTSTANSVKKRTAYAKTKVNLRKKRSTDSEVIKTLRAGAKVTVYGTSADGWFKVKAGSDVGYVSKEYIVSDQSKVERTIKDSASGSAKTRVAYAKTKVNLRKRRSTDSDVLQTLEAGAQVTVYGAKQDGWYKVKTDSATGYVRSDYLVSDKSKVEQEQSAQQTDASQTRYYQAGEQIRLSDSVNVRQSMSESASLVGLAYQGDVVTVVMSYAEGWTQVSWNGQTGYIKTEVLK